MNQSEICAHCIRFFRWMYFVHVHNYTYKYIDVWLVYVLSARNSERPNKKILFLPLAYTQLLPHWSHSYDDFNSFQRNKSISHSASVFPLLFLFFLVLHFTYVCIFQLCTLTQSFRTNRNESTKNHSFWLSLILCCCPHRRRGIINCGVCVFVSYWKKVVTSDVFCHFH